MADADSEEQDQSQISDDGQDAEMGTVGEESAEGNAESGDVEEEVYQTVGVTIKNKPYLCTYENCDKAFQWKSYLERHIQSHTGIKPNVSEKKRGPRKRKNADGTEDDTPKLYVCNDCGKEFNWKSYLDRHSQIHTGMKPFACDFAGCDYKTGQSGNLKMHKQTHTGEKPHACDWPDCEYRSTHPGNLKNHMLTHTGEKRFKCSIVGCEYQAIQYETLNQHMRTHTGEKPFKCPWEGCDYAGRQSATLKVHYLTHTGDKPYACSWEGCDYRSTHSGHVKKHYLGHTGEKPYACGWEECTYRASTSGALEVHKKSHTGVKPYFCMEPGCHFASIQSGSLKRHKLTHTGEKPYPCSHCSYAASQPGTLKRHIFKHHKEVHQGEEPPAATAEEEEAEGEDPGLASSNEPTQDTTQGTQKEKKKKRRKDKKKKRDRADRECKPDEAAASPRRTVEAMPASQQGSAEPDEEETEAIEKDNDEEEEVEKSKPQLPSRIPVPAAVKGKLSNEVFKIVTTPVPTKVVAPTVVGSRPSPSKDRTAAAIARKKQIETAEAYLSGLPPAGSPRPQVEEEADEDGEVEVIPALPEEQPVVAKRPRRH
ncbi:hypothetical protein RvY_03864-1 [Ramazzottius varieornatus]|uniref:C2H2-type domain-containing protein n=1 Tax=Ramazzottius varieornatus TaxID=947166 RepID=A0A1D1UPK0_RAMVA|nr:hypothetical protein RvY_03864-1 [Ramazzottius varieornatus]